MQFIIQRIKTRENGDFERVPFFSPRYLLFAARNKPISWLSLRVYACACIRAYPPRHFLSPPICGGKWKWAGVRLGGRVCVCLCVCVCLNGGSEGGGRMERGEVLPAARNIHSDHRPPPQGTALPLSQVSFICCKEYPQAALSYAYAPARLRTHIFPPPIYRGENGHLGAYARACMRVRMRMREDGCLSCCGLYTPPQPQPQPLPAAPQCGKMQNLRFAGLFLCGGVIYQPSGENAGEGGKMGKFG